MAAVALVLASCGGASAVDKCDDLITDLCERAVDCGLGNGGSVDGCIQEFQTQFGCGDAVAVSASYERCVDQINEFTCTRLFPIDPATGDQDIDLPADCEGVILF